MSVRARWWASTLGIKADRTPHHCRSTERMKKSILIAAVLGVAAFGAYRWHSSRQADRFVAEKKSEFSGYRVEHFEREKLLFLHRPDGTKNGVELAGLRRAYLYRLNASDAANNQNNYSWVIDSPRLGFSIPYFSVDPSLVLGILKKEHPEIDIEQSLKRAREFERDQFNFCTIWAPPGSTEIRPEKRYSACAPWR